jgi:pilus assembly protein CpaC
LLRQTFRSFVLHVATSSLKFRLGANNMQSKSMILARPIALALGAAMIFGSVAAADAAPRKGLRAKATKVVRAKPRSAPVGVQRPTGELYLSKGRGQLVNLASPVADVFVSNTTAVDVQVNSPTQLYVFGKDDGEASVYATTRSGQVAYSTNVRVSQNYGSLDSMLRLAMPDTDVKATLSGQVAVLTGTVKRPADIDEAGYLVKAFLNPGIDTSDPKAMLKVMVINRLRTATPLQVTLQVRIAEVSRSFGKDIGVNWSVNNRAPTSGGTSFSINNNGGKAAINLGGRLLGLNILSQLDLGEDEGLVTTLATPNLTALSGEKASFLAGGEFPIPIKVSNGGELSTTVEFKPYGVKLDFIPTVLADGRISLAVKPEVSEIDFERAVNVNGGLVPGLTTRRVETIVELGSGQSFVIGGLLRASTTNKFSKIPGAGDVPVLGALFRSNGWKRGETELMIVVTPYLVNPVSAEKIVLPTDGYKAPSELGRIFGGQSYKSGPSEKRPVPTIAPATTVRGVSVPAPGFSN